jgi:hypothetical protein
MKVKVGAQLATRFHKPFRSFELGSSIELRESGILTSFGLSRAVWVFEVKDILLSRFRLQQRNVKAQPSRKRRTSPVAS